MESTIHLIHNVTKIYPIIIPVSTIIYGILSRKSIGFVLALIAISGDLFNNMVLKKLSGRLYQYWYPGGSGNCTSSQLIRPLDANHPEKSSCGLFYDCIKADTPDDYFCGKGPVKIGMPSGHAQMASLMTLLFIFMLAKNTNIYNVLAMITFIAIAIWVSYSRILITCHTANQVLVGSLIGYVLGLLAYYLLKYLYPTEVIDVEWQQYLPLIAYVLIIIFINL